MLFKPKYHFYLYVFHSDGQLVEATLCYKKNVITSPRLLEAKRKAGVSDTAVIMNISYLGRMTRQDYELVL